jgi:hypothetical protein
MSNASEEDSCMETRYEKHRRIFDEFKKLVQELKVPIVICAHQAPREGYDSGYPYTYENPKIDLVIIDYISYF